jgi:hypothetical protein
MPLQTNANTALLRRIAPQRLRGEVVDRFTGSSVWHRYTFINKSEDKSITVCYNYSGDNQYLVIQMCCMFKKNIQWVWTILFLLAACGDAKEEKNVVKTGEPDTAIKQRPIDRNHPDPKIAVKEEYAQLTGEDIIKEDQTHLDISYFPTNYALTKGNNEKVNLKIRVLYSRANKRLRPVIFGDSLLIPEIPVPYGLIWRLGANESTEIEFLTDVVIEGKKLKRGRYSVYAIPNPDNWQLIFNTDLYTWGTYNHNKDHDKLIASARVEKRSTIAEKLLIYFQKTTEGANMIITWDNIQVVLPITILEAV